ncbi:MAG: protein kinase [Deltaproteobacteria bacterium]|nr:protein kinase [Deltaproteobacteria bacterium]
MTGSTPSSDAATSRRYETLLKLASGGMGTVYIGYLRGGFGFRQIVAIKRLHPHLLEDPDIRRTASLEASLASKVHHANVVDVRDVEVVGESIDLVMDYVEGASLSELTAKCRRVGAPFPVDVALTVAVDTCMGLHAAHEATDDTGKLLGLVHRDVSPHNILVGIDGVSRVTDFGIAKCLHGTDPSTREGMLKGKLGYMAPEYVATQRVDRRADVFAVGVVLWELLMGQRLFQGASHVDSIRLVLRTQVPPITSLPSRLAEQLDELLGSVLAHDPNARFDTTLAIATAIESVAKREGIELRQRKVAEFVQSMMHDELATRRQALRALLGSRASQLPEAPPQAAATTPEQETLATSVTQGASLVLPLRRPWWLAVPAVAAVGAALWLITHLLRPPTPRADAPALSASAARPVPDAVQPATAVPEPSPASSDSSVPTPSAPAPTRSTPRSIAPNPQRTAGEPARSSTPPAPTPSGPPPNPYAP